MVELQHSAEQLAAEGVQLYALSYDEPEALAAFQAEHGITYTLLSDPASETFHRFGIINTLIPPDDHPWYGVPFPGVYVTDGNGVVTGKVFEGHLAIRTTGEQVLRLARGAAVDTSSTGLLTTALAFYGGTATVAVSDRPLPVGLLRDLTVSWAANDTPERGTPAPSLEVTLDDSFIALDAADYGSSSVVAFAHNGSTVEKTPGGPLVTVSGEVRATNAADSPQAQRFELTLPVGRTVTAHYGGAEPGQMDADYHLGVLRSRRGV